ncbi:IS66 family insertion sequence element accessory protein TnpB, partial [Burkholderia ubonensis]
GNGFWLLLKRLEADRFVWPNGGDTITLSAEQLHWLLDGIDLAVIQKHPQRYYARMS